MTRSCLLCVGTKDSLEKLIRFRRASDKKDYMKFVFSIPVNEDISVSAEKLSPRSDLPQDEVLHTGYCGDECMSMLNRKGFENKFVICGVEGPSRDYPTHDLVFPQGRTERGETAREAAVREFFEETGIKVDNTSSIRLLGFTGKEKEMSVFVCTVQ